MKKLMIILSAAAAMMATVTFARPSVEITKVKLADARDGTVEYACTVSGDFEGKKYDLIVKVSADDGTKSAVLTTEEVSAGTVTKTVNVKELLGKAYPGVSFFAKLEETLGGVQLWQGGPYFAKCNVGATKPEESGYHFWWGDTVGYKYDGSKWVSVDGKDTTIEFSEVAPPSDATWGKGAEELKSEGWIGEDGNLVPTKDAATVHLGAPWRMPTADEMQALDNNCKKVSTTQNGVWGYLFTGNTTGYTDKSIFFPAAGGGVIDKLSYPNMLGYYWSSTPSLDVPSHSAYLLFFTYSNFGSKGTNGRYIGQSVRPVRDAE